MKRIALIACCKTKKAHAAPAQDLYQGDLFKKARAYAESHCDDFAILSAKYGLVRKDQVIEPYEQTLNKMPAAKRREWACFINARCRELQQEHPDELVVFVILAGEHYRAAFEKYNTYNLRYETPLVGLGGLGYQKKWLRENT
jgi:hypothetical protein